MIYLDYTANTPADPDVLDAYLAAERRYIANPNSTHIAGQEARAEMERVTQSIAQHLGVQPAEIIYTSGASEANNLALKGIAHASRHIGKHIISTQLEHSSVGASLSALQQQGYEIDLLDIGRDGRVDLDQLRELMRDDTILVAVCAVDSELGTIQPIREIAGIVKPYPGCRLHVDATQAVGKTDLWLDGVDTMSFTAHKFYGPNGIGALYKRRGLVIEPQISGGASTTIYRSGTPTLGLAVSLDAALTKALAGQDARNAHVHRNDEHDVEDDVEHRREHQKIQRCFAVAECAEHIGNHVVEHGSAGAEQNDEHIGIRFLCDVIRNLHPDENLAGEQTTDERQHSGERDTQQRGSCDAFAHAGKKAAFCHEKRVTSV